MSSMTVRVFGLHPASFPITAADVPAATWLVAHVCRNLWALRPKLTCLARRRSIILMVVLVIGSPCWPQKDAVGGGM